MAGYRDCRSLISRMRHEVRRFHSTAARLMEMALWAWAPVMSMIEKTHNVSCVAGTLPVATNPQSASASLIISTGIQMARFAILTEAPNGGPML